MRPCCLASLQTWSIIALYEWRLLSYAGALGVGWSIMWYFLCYKSPADHPRISAIEREYIEKALDTAPRKVRIRLWAPLHSWCFSERVQTVINLIVSIWLRCGAHVSYSSAAWCELAVPRSGDLFINGRTTVFLRTPVARHQTWRAYMRQTLVNSHPEARTARYGQRCSAVSGPTLWNSLLLSVNDPSLTLTQSCARLKTVILQSIRNTSIAPTWQFML